MQRRLFLKHLAEAGLGEEAWLKEVEESTLRALVARGSATAAQLAADEPRLRSQLLVAEGKDYAAVQNITSRVLNLLSQQGRIVRGRPRGTWISTQYHWSPVETWLPGGLTGMIAEEARVDAGRAVAGARTGRRHPPTSSGGPAGPAGRSRPRSPRSTRSPSTSTARRASCSRATPSRSTPPEPWVALLPALDPTIMGWVSRDWYLGPHGPTLFDRSGNPGPTVWVDGRVVGGWAQRASDGRVVHRLLEKVSAADAPGDRAARRRAHRSGWTR